MSTEHQQDRQRTLTQRPTNTPNPSTPRKHITQEPIHEYQYETRNARSTTHQHTGIASSNDYYMGEPTQMSDTNRYSRYLSTEKKHSHSIFIARAQKRKKQRAIALVLVFLAVVALVFYFLHK